MKLKKLDYNNPMGIGFCRLTGQWRLQPNNGGEGWVAWTPPTDPTIESLVYGATKEAVMEEVERVRNKELAKMIEE